MPEISRFCIPYTPFSGKLDSSRVGIVSTAGVHLKSHEPFVLQGDTSYRPIPAEAVTQDLTVTHDHYDHSDARRDINCVFPVEILRELVSEGRLGSSTGEHLCMGFSQAMREIKERVALEIAAAVRRWKPDIILLTAGWPLCHRTVVTLQRAIEMEGIPAVLITVDPEQSEQARPSRAFHPAGFKLGHSLGPPGARELQKRVLMDALDLLIHPKEPGTIVSKEYPEYPRSWSVRNREELNSYY